MKRMWLSTFKRELEIYLKGTIVVKVESSSLISDTEIVYVVIHNDGFTEPFVHNIGTVDNVLSFNPIDVAQSFIRYYKGLIANKFFKK